MSHCGTKNQGKKRFVLISPFISGAILPVGDAMPSSRPGLSRKDAVGCRAAACRRAVSPMGCGPATSAGPTHHSVIVGIIRKARSACMNPG